MESITQKKAHHVFRVDGMTCGGCVAAVRNVLSRQPGVSGSSVELGKIELDLDASVGSLEGIRKAVSNAGFELVIP